MSRAMTEKPNCFSNAVEKTKASCCFSLPFRSHIPPCFYLFPANSSDGLTDTSTSKSYRCSLGGTTPSEVRVNLEARDDRGFDMDLPSRSARASAPSLRPRTASGEREHTILQSLWLEQQQMVTLQRKEEAGFILDKASGRKYRRGKLLGKVGAMVYASFYSLPHCCTWGNLIEVPREGLGVIDTVHINLFTTIHLCHQHFNLSGCILFRYLNVTGKYDVKLKLIVS